MNRISRRGFVGKMVAGGVALGMQGLVARCAMSGPVQQGAASGSGFGPLRPRATLNTKETLLELPDGFEYVVFGKTGDRLNDGFITPPNHDGMAAFQVKGAIRLVRNHEIVKPVDQTMGDLARAYDPVGGGGTITLEIDPVTRAVRKQFVSLTGTSTNCAGGATPWGSWISCEETTRGVGEGFTQPHGYCFEVPADLDRAVIPVPIRRMGRFVHEAVAVDPETHIVYLTEDGRETAGLYRYIPIRRTQLAAGGKLQMLAIAQQKNYDTRTGQTVRQPLPVTWVDIPEPDHPSAELNPKTVQQQGFERGAAIFTRLEGIAYDQGSIYFTSTDGGNLKLGQVWEYRIRAGGRPRPAGAAPELPNMLELVHESSDASRLDMPDNICVSRQGSLVICEDGKTDQFVRALTPDGRLLDIARNIVPGNEDKEFAGATFSPDYQTLFFNNFRPGMTFAVWGPWEKGGL